MNPSVKFEMLSLVLTSLVIIGIQAAAVDILGTPATEFLNINTIDAEKTLSEYLITRDDIHQVLSKIINPSNQIAVLTDFDGTIAEIQPDPSTTTIKPESKSALEQLVTRPNVLTAVISGRPMYNVRARVGLKNITYSGNHGMEIVFPNATEYHHQITPEMYENCLELKAILNEKYGAQVYGATVEDKNISLVYHYANVSLDIREKVLAEITTHVIQHGYIPVPSHGAIEIKPPVVWSKGHAAVLILNEFYGKNWDENVHVIFMGDDTSDEDAMKLLRGRATTFRITPKPDLKSYATYKMQSVETATFILEWIASRTISQ